MKAENIAEIVGAIIAGIFTFYFYTSNETVFALIACIVAFLLLFLFLKGILNKEEPFVEVMNKILRTYDSILVEIECFPKLNDKKIVKAKYFKDLVNVQFDLRKPIYYYKEEECCNFLILSSDTAYVYVLKKNKEYTSKLELLVDTQDLQNMKKFEIIENFEMPKKEEPKPVEENKTEIKEEPTTSENNNKVHFYKDLDPDELAMFNEVISFKNENNSLNDTETQEEQESSNEGENQYEEPQTETQESSYEEDNQNVESQSEEQDNSYEEENQYEEPQTEAQESSYEEDNQNVESQSEEQDNSYEDNQYEEPQTEEQEYSYEEEMPYVENQDEEINIEEKVPNQSYKVENNNSNKKSKQLTIEKYEIDHVNKKSNKHNYRPYDDTMANLSEDELDKQFEDLLNELNDLDVE